MPSKKGEPFRWDGVVRLTHWGLAAICIGNLWFNEAGEEWHEWLGYGAIALVALRLLWGVTWARGYARLDALLASKRKRCVSVSLQRLVITVPASWRCGLSGCWCWRQQERAGFRIPRRVSSWEPMIGTSGVPGRCKG